jgi:mRNA interferase MazF
MAKYIPDRGDIIWLNFTPQSGHEHAGKRPALVISPKEYNKKVGLMIACPITSKVKGYPFEVELSNKKIKGVVLSDQVKSFDWRSRNASLIDKASADILRSVLDKLLVLLQ